MSNTIVKKTRKQRGFTQKELANELNVSRNIIVALERGDRELRMSEAKKLSDLLGVKVEALSGDQLPDFEKFKHMFIYLLSCLRKGEYMPKTKLAKMIYLGDFAWYYYNLESMSGMSYRRYPYGPVADEFFRAFDQFELESLISVKVTETEDGHKCYLTRLAEGGRKAAGKGLADDEKELLEDIFTNWSEKSTPDIVSFTHQQLPYKLAVDDEIISYELITQEEEKDLY
jgi:transcriptional regulator with XRE-family HTH domain